jgi:hypothetical protein
MDRHDDNSLHLNRWELAGCDPVLDRAQANAKSSRNLARAKCNPPNEMLDRKAVPRREYTQFYEV